MGLNLNPLSGGVFTSSQAGTGNTQNFGTQTTTKNPGAAAPFVNFASSLMSPSSQQQQLNSQLMSRAQSGSVNPYTQNLINANANQAAYNLPIQLNQIRGQFFNAPAGRTQLGLQNAVTQENLGLANMKSGLENTQYNQDIANALAAGQNNSSLAGIGSGYTNALTGATTQTQGGQQTQSAQQSTPSGLNNLLQLLAGQQSLTNTGNGGVNLAALLGLNTGMTSGLSSSPASNTYGQQSPTASTNGSASDIFSNPYSALLGGAGGLATLNSSNSGF